MSQQFRNHSVRGPVNAWLFRALSNYMDKLFGPSKRRLFWRHPDTVVEIGPGAGANMRYMRKGTTLIAVEPNVHMHRHLKQCADQYGINLRIMNLVGEKIDLPDESVDFVVCTLVLCTVEDPYQCLLEIKRILRPYGKFVFIEHVKAKDHTVIAWLQNLLHKPWHWFFEGCHTNRNTKGYLLQARFTHLELEEYHLFSPFIPIMPQIRGVAVR